MARPVVVASSDLPARPRYEVADIFRRYGPAYRRTHRLPLQHHQVMNAIERCRTAALGGHVDACDSCGHLRISYHSCRNRHCPTCQQDAAHTWLTRQQDLLLPVPYFLVTFTLPATLRDLARQHQRRIYTLFFRASAAALQQLAHDPRFLGGQIGMLGVLQTWTRDLRSHPHIHYLVPAIGLASDGTWTQPSSAFLVHVKPLASLFRAKFRAALCQTPLGAQVPAQTWRQPWVVDCRAVGSGRTALKYLAPYIFRVALSNNRIVRVADDQVTFRYLDGETRQPRRCTLSAEEFIRRFLQHILPKGSVKVRYYGLFSPGKRQLLSQLRQLLALAAALPQTPVTSSTSPPRQRFDVCPRCGQPLVIIPLLPYRCRSPPRPMERASVVLSRN